MENNQHNPDVERVLVIDDSREIRNFLRDYILEPRGFEVITAVDGLEGLKLAVSEKPDLMIVDLQMPHMDGLELMRRLKSRRFQIPTILATAHGSEQVAVEAFRLGVRDYVIKPFVVEEIQETIDRAMRESRLQHERDQLVRQLMESNARLRRRAQELNALYGIGKSVSSSLELEKVLQRVIEAAVYLSGAEEGALMLLDEEQEDLYIRASKNIDTETQSMRTRINDSQAGRVMRSKQTTILNREDLQQNDIPAGEMPSIAYVPLVERDKAIGVLSVTRRGTKQAFDSRETRVLSALASYAAGTITNARLYNRINSERIQLRTILDQIDDPVLVIDARHCVVLANEAARETLALPSGDLTGRPVSALIANEETLAFITQPAGADQLQRQAEIEVNEGQHYDIGLTPIEDVGRTIVMRDITKLYHLNQAKSNLVAIVSHDLRSPLTSILGYVQLMERAGPLNEAQKSFVDRVQEGVARITALISDLLDLDKLESGMALDPAPCSPLEILEDILETIKPALEKQDLTLNMNVRDRPQVFGDRQRLHQAFGNLITNAVKYTPAGGRIDIRLGQRDKQVLLQVEDTGIGIDPADQPHIFERFYRGKNVPADEEGTGLGLSIVKSIVEQHEGRIWVNSTPGEGTTFVIVLPAHQSG